jgi:uncharacterized protein YggU (UPF0235/DUF167 family)
MSTIRVKVTPDSRKERFLQTADDAFTISVREPAEGNQANLRVRELLAAHFKVPVQKVRIEAGHHSPQKRIHIAFTKNGA